MDVGKQPLLVAGVREGMDRAAAKALTDQNRPTTGVVITLVKRLQAESLVLEIPASPGVCRWLLSSVRNQCQQRHWNSGADIDVLDGWLSE